VALKIFEVIERDNLAANARHTGEFLKAELQRSCTHFPKSCKASAASD
jgi:4-aminobutyrate aminotransferase-like enzyme